MEFSEKRFVMIGGSRVINTSLPLQPLGEQAQSDSIGGEEISSDKRVDVAPPLLPYNKGHLVVVVSSKEDPNKPIPSIVDLNPEELLRTLILSKRVIEAYIKHREVRQVGFGFNGTSENLNSEKESPSLTVKRRGVAGVPGLAHFHITPFIESDFIRNLTPDQRVRLRQEWRPGFHDPVKRIAEEVLREEVFGRLSEESDEFRDVFRQVEGYPRQNTFILNDGLEVFADPRFARLLQKIQHLSRQAYNELLGSFCIFDRVTGIFPETEKGRFVLREENERRAGVEDYLSKRPNFSRPLQNALLRLARYAKHEDDLLSGKTKNEMVVIANKLILMKGLSTTTSVAINRQGKCLFGMDGLGFSSPGTPSAHRWEDGLIDLVFWRENKLFSGKENEKSEEFQQIAAQALSMSTV